jgi:hypothetical protein
MKKTLAVFGLMVCGIMFSLSNSYSLTLDEILKKLS